MVLSAAPALLNEIKFTMELRIKKCNVAVRFNKLKQSWFLVLEVQLIEKNSATATGSLWVGTLKTFALSTRCGIFIETVLCKNETHTLEPSRHCRMVFWEIKSCESPLGSFPGRILHFLCFPFQILAFFGM